MFLIVVFQKGMGVLIAKDTHLPSQLVTNALYDFNISEYALFCSGKLLHSFP